MKTVKLLIFSLLVILATLCLSGCTLCFHSYEPASCAVAQTCSKCNQTKGEALGHHWQAATCEQAATCKTCGKTQGEKLAHGWRAPTCETPATCEACGATTGSATGHTLRAATCTTPQKCVTCGKTTSPALGHHSRSEATCTAGEKCVRCGTLIRAALGHAWQNATCTEPKTCIRCYATDGFALRHDYRGVSCERCYEINPGFLSFSQYGTNIYYKVLGVPNSAIAVKSISWKSENSTLYIDLDCQKTFDIFGKSSNDRSYFIWKLYDNKGYIVDSGEIRTEDLVKGDRFKEQIKIRNIDLTKTYHLKLYDYEYFN